MEITVDPSLWKYIKWAIILLIIASVVFLAIKLKLYQKVISLFKKIS